MVMQPALNSSLRPPDRVTRTNVMAPGHPPRFPEFLGLSPAPFSRPARGARRRSQRRFGTAFWRTDSVLASDLSELTSSGALLSAAARPPEKLSVTTSALRGYARPNMLGGPSRRKFGHPFRLA